MFTGHCNNMIASLIHRTIDSRNTHNNINNDNTDDKQ